MASSQSRGEGPFSGSRVGRWLRRFLEKRLANYYEGPDAPERLAEMVVWFANANPHATRAEWVEFAALHAAECYRSGYVRGYEYSERDPVVREFQPEEVADALYPDWRWAPEIRLDGKFDYEPLEDEKPERPELPSIAERFARHKSDEG